VLIRGRSQPLSSETLVGGTQTGCHEASLSEIRMAPAGGHRSVSTQEHQFAVSNTTVNKFLGGRQPSWMTNAKPVKPTPRPPNQPPKQPLPELLPPRRSSSSSSRPAPPPHSQQQQRPSVVPAAEAATASNSSHLPPPQPQPTPVAATNTITT
jgi:zinc finger MIZ domain-containing protein